jgi:hypothetical protein
MMMAMMMVTFFNMRARYNNSANVQNRKLKCGGTVGADVTL